MADIQARTEIGVTTGPIRGSRKIHVGEHRVAMREIVLDPSCSEPPLRVYDTAGPYTDPTARIDIAAFSFSAAMLSAEFRLATLAITRASRMSSRRVCMTSAPC